MTSDNVTGAAAQYLRNQTSRLFEVVKSSASSTRTAPALHPKVAALVEAYASSQIAAAVRNEISSVQAPEGPSATLPDVEEENAVLRGRQRASWSTQFRILSGRAFKNLYRDPALLWTHYIAAISIARTCERLHD